MGSPVIIDFKEGENPFADEKPAQKRQTQSQMRAERRQKANERMRAKSASSQNKEERKAIAQARKDGTGLVLSKRPKKKDDSKLGAKKAPKKK